MVVLGRVFAPYGVQGWLKIRPFGDDPESWRAMPQWWLGATADGAAWQAYPLEGLRKHAAGWIVKLAGIDDRTAAEKLSGWYFGATREELPTPEPDEYYWADLIGMAVENLQEQALGTVATLMETGAHQVLVVKDGETQRLLPFVGQVIKNVDVGAGIIRVDWGMDW